MRKHLMVILKNSRQAERQSQQARCLRSQVEARRIRGTHDDRERDQRGVGQLIFRQESIETAELANVSQLHARDIKRYRTFALGDGQHLVRGYKEKFRRLIDEPLDQLGAGNAVNFRALARNPFHVILRAGSAACILWAALSQLMRLNS